MATATNDALDSVVGECGNGNSGGSVMTLSSVDANGGGRGGGGDKFEDGLAGSMESVPADSGSQLGALGEQHARHPAAPHSSRQQRPRLHHDGRQEKVLDRAVATARSFYHPSEIALRSRRLCHTYGGRGDGDDKWGSVLPRRADTVRRTKVADAGRSKFDSDFGCLAFLRIVRHKVLDFDVSHTTM